MSSWADGPSWVPPLGVRAKYLLAGWTVNAWRDAIAQILNIMRAEAPSLKDLQPGFAPTRRTIDSHHAKLIQYGPVSSNDESDGSHWRYIYVSLWRDLFLGRLGFLGFFSSALPFSPAKRLTIEECLMKSDSPFSNEAKQSIRQYYYSARREERLSAFFLLLASGMAIVLPSAIVSVAVFTNELLGISISSSTIVAFYYCLLVIGCFVSVTAWRIRVKERLLAQLLDLLFTMERNQNHWEATYCQQLLSSRIERCARLFEQLPRSYGGFHVNGSDAIISRRAVGVATHFRQYGLWVAFPGPFTYTDLIAEVRLHYIGVASNHWYDLPSAEVEINLRTNRVERLVLWLLVVILFAGLLALAVFQAKLGLSGTLASSVLAIIIVLLLARLGLSISALQKAADAAKASGAIGK